MHAGVLLDAAPLSTNDLIEKLNTNILPKIRQQLNDLSKSSDNNDATEALKKQLQVRYQVFICYGVKHQNVVTCMSEVATSTVATTYAPKDIIGHEPYSHCMIKQHTGMLL